MQQLEVIKTQWADQLVNNLALMGKVTNGLSNLYDWTNMADPRTLDYFSRGDNGCLTTLHLFAWMLLPSTIVAWLDMPEGVKFFEGKRWDSQSFANLQRFHCRGIQGIRLKLDNVDVENVHTLNKEATEQLMDEAEGLFNDAISVVHRIRNDVLVPQKHWSIISMPSLLIEAQMRITKARFKCSESLLTPTLKGYLMLSHWNCYQMDFAYGMASLLHVFLWKPDFLRLMKSAPASTIRSWWRRTLERQNLFNLWRFQALRWRIQERLCRYS